MTKEEREILLAEYQSLDKKLTRFREHWNRKAYADIKAVKKGKVVPPQAKLPIQWHEDVARWKELKRILGIY